VADRLVHPRDGPGEWPVLVASDNTSDKEIATVEKVIRALNLLEQDGRVGGGKAGIDDLVEICPIEKNDWITG
jgi:hypothetical protein